MSAKHGTLVYARSYKDSTDTLFPVIIFCHGFAIDIFLQKVTLDDSVLVAPLALLEHKPFMIKGEIMLKV